MNTSEEQMIKRRRVPRREYGRKVGILYAGQYQVLKAYEIGERGMLIEASQSMKVGELLVITFQVPGLDLAVVRGVVRYKKELADVSSAVVGIEFVNIDFEFKRQIRHFVAATSEIKKASSMKTGF